MNKIKIFSLVLALGAAFTACDNYEEPNPAPQSNAQEPILQASGISILPDVPEGTIVDLQNYETNAEEVPVATIASIGTLPSYYTLALTAELSATDAFDKVIEVPATINIDVATLSPSAINEAYQTLVTKDPADGNIYIRYKAYATNGSKSRVRIGGPDVYYCPMMMGLKPFAPAVTYESSYSIVGTQTIKFSHSDKSVYDDPVFTALIQVTADQAANGGFKWAIAPATTLDGGNLYLSTPDDQTLATSGTLVEYTGTPVYGVIENAGPYLFTFNVVTREYSYIQAYERLYLAGDAQGWNPATAMQLTTNDYETYQGYAVLSPGGFKVVLGPDWSAGDYGQGDAEGTIGHGDNLTVPEAGLYWVKVNLPALTIDCTHITTIGVIGDATPDGWAGSTALTPSADWLTWTGNIPFAGTGEWKFRANNDWGVNLGGELGNLVQDGGNLPTPGAGTKTVTLKLSTLPYQATVE